MKDLLTIALRRLEESDMHLMRTDANERTITHRLAEHLRPLVDGYDVDCEYNRDHMMVKRLQSHGFDGQNVAPDIIVHKRGTDDNMLVVEAKKTSASQAEKDEDRRKLKAFVCDLGYKYAAFVCIRTGVQNPGIDSVEWF